MLKITVIKEGKNPPDERVPLSPSQCKAIMSDFPNVNITVQNSKVRRFKDQTYLEQGVTLTDDVSDAEILLGVKEVPIQDLLPNKTYFFFSHTIKKQPYNKKLLQEAITKNIKLVDWETLTRPSGGRLIGFGRYAGIVGAYNTFLAYGLKHKSFELKRAFKCENRKELEKELLKVQLPSNYKITVTGNGKVAKGAIEILDTLKIKKVSPSEYLSHSFNEPVYTQLHPSDYFKHKENIPLTNKIVYTQPEVLNSNFMPYAKVSNMYIAGHYWDNKCPFIFTREDAKNRDFNIDIVGDISCDIDGPVAVTLRPSTIENPLYAYDPQTEKEVSLNHSGAITVMAVDNLPCELPIDASENFGKDFIEHILPHIIEDKENIIKNATICENGSLTKRYMYLEDYIAD